jgi:MFS family permease
MTIFIFLPHQKMNVYAGMTFTLGFGTIIFTMRAVFFAPMEEVEIPREISGAATSVACFVGYAPSMFAFPLFGSLIDKTPGINGYKQVFLLMIAFSVLGFILSSLLVHMVNKKKALGQEAA